jgi:hypothetical protein
MNRRAALNEAHFALSTYWPIGSRNSIQSEILDALADVRDSVGAITGQHVADQRFLRGAFELAFNSAPKGDSDPLTATRRASLLAHLNDNESILESLAEQPPHAFGGPL